MTEIPSIISPPTPTTPSTTAQTNNNKNDTPTTTKPILYSSPTIEMKVVWNFISDFFFPSQNKTPSFATKFLQYFLVTPLAHFSNGSFEFQIYLYHVFHTTKLARIVHTICLPLMTLACVTVFAQFKFYLVKDPSFYGYSSSTNTANQIQPQQSHVSSLSSSNSSNNSTPPLLLEWNGAYLVAFLLSLWYCLTALINKVPALMFALIPLLFGLAHIGAIIQTITAYPPALSTWYAPAPLLYNPLVWIPLLGLALSCSHLKEPLIPPPFSGSTSWIPIEQYYNGPSDRPYTKMEMLWKLIITIPYFPGAVFDEFWAGWRLLPIAVLEIFVFFGYVPEVYSRAKHYAEKALATGNPALNFIGTGGYAPLPVEKEE